MDEEPRCGHPEGVPVPPPREPVPGEIPSWLDEQWTTNEHGWRRWPWPLTGWVVEPFTVRLSNALGKAPAIRIDMCWLPLTCWRQLVDASLRDVLGLRGVGRVLARELLGHLRAAGVEPAWGVDLDGKAAPVAPVSAVDRTVAAIASQLAGLANLSTEVSTVEDLRAALDIAAVEKAALEAQLDEARNGRQSKRSMPSERASVTHKFDVGGHVGYLTVGMYPDGRPGEIFITLSKVGSTMAGMMDAFSTAVSVALQYGAPLDDLVEKFSHQRFEPCGWSGDKEIGHASSIVDYVFRWVGRRFGSTVPKPPANLEEGK